MILLALPMLETNHLPFLLAFSPGVVLYIDRLLVPNRRARHTGVMVVCLVLGASVGFALLGGPGTIDLGDVWPALLVWIGALSVLTYLALAPLGGARERLAMVCLADVYLVLAVPFRMGDSTPFWLLCAAALALGVLTTRQDRPRTDWRQAEAAERRPEAAPRA
jgi:hypothetical protein